ncbi:juvenile hormone esterase-like [Uranotaenia lowii]|uniref:juvenile hormone esterase-like n=1 Tax=Uranotaenia lowii TaxID=190385 RepID=UPI002478D78D|nr:juvenile hormone esterase-like [Uranotaenia lowii]XP_055607199.1 juvenile hormone esterase-like [Uranotaenia lowii]
MYWKFGVVFLIAVLIFSGGKTLAERNVRQALASSSKPLVCIQDGCIRGTQRSGLDNGPYEAFMGVPFAKPPLGPLRFKNPVPFGRFNGIYDAGLPKGVCVQKTDLLPQAVLMGSEDCLYLNVYRPKTRGQLLPVLVYIHGGGYLGGTAHPGVLGPEKFMDTEKIILVTFQYRLGVFGFLSTGDQVAPGNFGLKDQLLALKWVKKNIDKFGGDPKQITIAGNSAGASSVQMMMMNPAATGLFSRAIMMSASALAYWNAPIDDPLGLARAQANAVEIPSAATLSSSDLVSALRDIDAYKLAGSIDKLKFWDRHPLALYHPVIETYIDSETFFSEDWRVKWASGRYIQVPLMISYVPNEGSTIGLRAVTNDTLFEELVQNAQVFIPKFAGADPSKLPKLKERFFGGVLNPAYITHENAFRFVDMITEAAFMYPLIKTIKQHQLKGSHLLAPITVSFFNYRGKYSYGNVYSGIAAADYGVCHQDELIYLFRSPFFFPDYQRNSPDWQMGQKLMAFYLDFIYNGKITQSSEPVTPCTILKCPITEFKNSSDPNIPVTSSVRYGLDENLYKFWNEVYQA